MWHSVFWGVLHVFTHGRVTCFKVFYRYLVALDLDFKYESSKVAGYSMTVKYFGGYDVNHQKDLPFSSDQIPAKIGVEYRSWLITELAELKHLIDVIWSLNKGLHRGQHWGLLSSKCWGVFIKYVCVCVSFYVAHTDLDFDYSLAFKYLQLKMTGNHCSRKMPFPGSLFNTRACSV